MSNFLYYKVCNQKWQPSESRACEQLWGPQWKLRGSGIDEPLPPTICFMESNSTDWQQTRKFCWIIDAAWWTSALRRRMDKVPYHTEWFPTMHKQFLRNMEATFTVIAYIWIWRKSKFNHLYTCPLKRFFNLNAMHSVNKLLWTCGRKKILGIHKNIESSHDP